jgi:hypothetical protein
MRIIKIKLGEDLKQAIKAYMATLPVDDPDYKAHCVMDIIASNEVE